MSTTLTYGKSGTCTLDLEETTLLRSRPIEPVPLDQIATQVRAQLAKPIDYPPLAQATVPGDGVVLAVEPGIPQQLAVIDGVLKALRDAGVEGARITILLACASTDVDSLQAELATLGHHDCRIKIHDADNEDEIAFLGVSQTGVALRLNRELCEADLSCL